MKSRKTGVEAADSQEGILLADEARRDAAPPVADSPGSAGILPAAISRAGSPRSQEDILPAAISRAGSPRSQEGILPADEAHCFLQK